MNWFFISFQTSFYDKYALDKFIKRFESIYNAIRQPVDFCLFELKGVEEGHKSYYISCPDEHMEHLIAPLAMLQVKEVSKPDINSINLICGKVKDIRVI